MSQDWSRDTVSRVLHDPVELERRLCQHPGDMGHYFSQSEALKREPLTNQRAASVVI